MDGRLLSTCLALFFLAAVGCRNTQTTAQMPPGTGGSMIERAFTKSPPGPIKSTAPVETVDAKENKTPLKSETVAVFAELQVDATFNNEELTPQERDQRLDEARQKFQKALQQDPKNIEALRGLGRLYTRLGDRDRAAQVYQTAIQAHPRNHMLAHEAALSYGRFDNWEMALQLWQHALSIDPDSRKYPRMIGLAQARLGNYEAGFSTMMKVCGEAEARTVMARELLDAGQTEAGRQQLDLAMKADPTFAPAQQLAQQLSGVQQAGFQQ
jgi:tetratricopeptide (TPR) repeat protein